jgi:hypothetical protein
VASTVVAQDVSSASIHHLRGPAHPRALIISLFFFKKEKSSICIAPGKPGALL